MFAQRSLGFMFSGEGFCAKQHCSLKRAHATRRIIEPRQRGDLKQFERLKTDGESVMPGNVRMTWYIINFVNRSTGVLLLWYRCPDAVIEL
jgi:hypothetical protein